MTTDQAPTGAAFLLAQVGAHAAAEFGRRVSARQVSAPQAGLLRLVGATPGMSQQQLAERLGMQPSRVVAFVDELEQAGLVRRQRDDADRRRNVIALTAKGTRALAAVASVAAEHETLLLAALSSAERAQLAALLGRVAAQQGLLPGVHPGYRSLARPTRA